MIISNKWGPTAEANGGLCSDMIALGYLNSNAKWKRILSHPKYFHSNEKEAYNGKKNKNKLMFWKPLQMGIEQWRGWRGNGREEDYAATRYISVWAVYRFRMKLVPPCGGPVQTDPRVQCEVRWVKRPMTPQCGSSLSHGESRGRSHAPFLGWSCALHTCVEEIKWNWQHQCGFLFSSEVYHSCYCIAELIVTAQTACTIRTDNSAVMVIAIKAIMQIQFAS